MTEPNPVINYDGQSYRIADLVPPPPGITPDTMGPALTWIEQLLSLQQLASNRDDPQDVAEGEQKYAERQALTKGALATFPENETNSQAEVQQVQQQNQMAEQFPQLVSGLAGGIAGAIGGALKPLTEIPQQAAQLSQGMMQQGLGALKAEPDSALDPIDEALLDESILGPDEFGSGADNGGPGAEAEPGSGPAGTAPMAMLGPQAPGSAPTTPASSRSISTPLAPTASTPTTAMPGAMGGYPLMPPGPLGGNTSGSQDDKPATKRVSVPSVKNGAPVQGRITAPPVGPTVTKSVEDKPATTRRIVIPTDKSVKPE